MDKEFVTFEIAKKLKEKGYPQIEKWTLAMYNEDGEWYSLCPTFDEYYYDFKDFDRHDFVCPTISQVLKWFRKEKNICLSVDAEQKYSYEQHSCLWKLRRCYYRWN